MRVERQILFNPLDVEADGRKPTKSIIFEALIVHIVSCYKSWM